MNRFSILLQTTDMNRRKALASLGVAGTIPAVAGSLSLYSETLAVNELFELRSYEMTFGNSHKIMIDYLHKTLKPAMQSTGVNHFIIMDEFGDAEPRKIWVLISYPNAETYINCQAVTSDVEFINAASEYIKETIERKIYNRFDSMLLSAFDGMKQMMNPKDDTSLFELRIYEGQNEDAVRRKIQMFDDEEIDLFLRVGLHPLFFGNLIAGPYRPALVYMLQFRDMEERQANWNKFGAHPEWNTMKVKPEYANTVSNIRKIFLKPI